MKTYFFGVLFVLLAIFSGAQSTFAQQSPSGAAGDPIHNTIDGTVSVRIESDNSRPRWANPKGPSVRKEAATRAARDTALERELAEQRQEQQAHNKTSDDRLSSLESRQKALELKGVSPNDPELVAIREEVRSIRSSVAKIEESDQSDKDWRWILGLIAVIALVLAILALILRGRGTSNLAVSTNNDGDGLLVRVGKNESKDLKLSFKNPKNRRRATAPAPSDPAPPPTADHGTSVPTGTGGNPYAPPQSPRTPRDPAPPTGGSGSSGSGSSSTRSASGSSSASNKQVEDPNFHIVSLSETEGPSSGGQAVTILGPGVDNAKKVNFSGTTQFPAKIIERAKDKLVVMTPAHKADPVSVCIEDADGKRAWAPKASGSLRAYTFVDPPAASKPKDPSEPAMPPDAGLSFPFTPKAPDAPDHKDVEPVFNPALADALAQAEITNVIPKSKGPKANAPDAPDLKDVEK